MTETLPAAVSGIRSAFFATLRNVEWRQAGSGQDYTFTGEAAVFDSWSEELWTPRGYFRERIRPGAFSDVLANKPDVRLLFNHDENFVMARTKSGTLELSEEDDALRVWARVAPTSYATDLRMAMERNDIDQMSFSFEFEPDRGASDKWYQDKQTGEIRRDVLKVSDIFDVSPVTFPAYVNTTAAMRTLNSAVTAGRIKPAKSDERKRYKRTLQAIAEKPWAILPSTLALIISIVQSRAEGERLTDEEIRERIGSSREKPEIESGPVAVLPLYGPIVPRADLFTEVSGLTAVQGFQSMLRSALADEEVSAILIDIDSPGGHVDLVPELATEIREARGAKPIVAVANTLAASAAYWIGTAADEFVVTPSGEVGSIGVYAAHQDLSGAQEKLGIKTTLVSAGKYKVEGNPFEPLSDEAREEIQRGVDEFYDMFVAAVAQGRGVSQTTVLNDFGQGRVLTATNAMSAGMVDRIETFDATLARLMKGGTAKRKVARAGTDPVGNQTAPDGAQAETDPAVIDERDVDAQAETDPAENGPTALQDLRTLAKETSRQERESYLRLLKEINRP